MFHHNELHTFILSRREELLDQSEHTRLVIETLKSGESHPFYATALAQMGNLLIEIGSYLKTRYGETQADVALLPCAESSISGTSS
jgi:hypothetical protein